MIYVVLIIVPLLFVWCCQITGVVPAGKIAFKDARDAFTNLSDNRLTDLEKERLTQCASAKLARHAASLTLRTIIGLVPSFTFTLLVAMSGWVSRGDLVRGLTSRTSLVVAIFATALGFWLQRK